MGDSKIPPAIAQGRAAQTPDAVSPLRTGIVAGVLAALYLFAIFLVHPIPGRIIRIFGVKTDDVGRRGGLVMTWRAPQGANLGAIVDWFASREQGARIERIGNSSDFVVTVPGVGREDAALVAARIAKGGGLGFHEVIETPKMHELARLLDLPMNGAKPLDLEIDQWRTDSGQGFTDNFLMGDSREVIEAALQKATSLGWAPPAGTHVAFEFSEWNPDKPPYWRTYVISDKAALGGDSIANASGSYDPNTNRPLVLLDFDRKGTDTFAELTMRIVGHKLAIVVDGEVKSAPVIQTKITGGRASITMGVSDPKKEEHERDLLVATLRGAGLPPGGEVLIADWKPPGDTQPKVWSARLLIGIGGGLLVGLLAWAIIRALRPTRRRGPARAGGPLPWSRIFVTLMAPLAIYVASKIPVLGIDREELTEVVGQQANGMFTIGMLGLSPVISAYIVVEILALVIPGWRRRRHAGPDARRPLDHAVTALTLALVLFQTWTILKYLESIGGFGFAMTPLAGYDRVLVVGSLLAGTALFAGVAKLIRHHGVGNGFGVLLASSWLVGAGWPWVKLGPLLSTDHILGGATLVVLAIPIAVALRWRVGAVGEATLRIPSSGVSPLGDAGGLVVLYVLIASLPLPGLSMNVLDGIQYVGQHVSLIVGLVVVMTLVWSWAFARPSITNELAKRVGLSPVSSGTFWRATALSAAVLLFLLGPSLLPGYASSTFKGLTSAMFVAVVVAVGLDVFDDLRARRVALEPAWSLQQAQHADLVAHDLASAGIPFHFSSSNLRTLLAFFAPFVPIDVLVPAEHVPAARTRIAALLAP